MFKKKSMYPAPVAHDLVLVGAGHSNISVLRYLGMKKIHLVDFMKNVKIIKTNN